jgi:5-formyltetrahydrofolate cyclo-ligase
VTAIIEEQKRILRRAAREKRLGLVRGDFAAAIARHADALGISTGAVVGGYHALPEEADPALLLARLSEMGCRIAFPRVVAEGLPLEFHFVPDGERLTPGAFKIHEPWGAWPRANPTLLLVPLLAFDASGHRLGFGGGYYDRTIADLQVPTIGIAYAGQQVASLPHQAHDRTLYMVLTEEGIRRFS